MDFIICTYITKSFSAYDKPNTSEGKKKKPTTPLNFTIRSLLLDFTSQY